MNLPFKRTQLSLCVGLIVSSGYQANAAEDEIEEIKLKELKNGRLAMFCIGGIIHHQIIYDSETLGDFANFNPFAH